jgi:hypothetical protein
MEGFVGRLRGSSHPGKRGIEYLASQKSVYFGGILGRELQSIAQSFEEENVNAGATLREKGTDADRRYALEEGRISISSKKSG